MAEYLNKDSTVSQAGANGKRKLYYLHIDFGIEQFVKGLFAGGVPYWHLKVLDQERTNHLVQDQEQEIAATERNGKCCVKGGSPHAPECQVVKSFRSGGSSMPRASCPTPE